MKKFIKDFKTGDVIEFHGALFIIESDAQPSTSHNNLIDRLGESGRVFHTTGRWLAGQIVAGYFGPSSNWTFQGNDLAGQYSVIPPEFVNHAIVKA